MPMPLGFHHSTESKALMSLVHTGKKHRKFSLEARKKISQSLTGRHPTVEARINMSIASLGHPKSARCRANMSAAAFKRFEDPKECEKMSGPNSARWRGGFHVPYGPEFNQDLRTIILKRDDYLCQNTFCYLPENGKKHDVHHVDFIKSHNDSANLITLCHSCHSKSTTGDRNHWMGYYKNLQEMRGIG